MPLLSYSVEDIFSYADVILLFSSVSLAYNTIFYFMNKAAGNAVEVANYKNEVKTIILNVILIVLLVGFWQAFDYFYASAFSSSSILELSQQSIDTLIGYVHGLFKPLLEVSQPLSAFSSMSGSWSFSVWMFKVGIGLYQYAGERIVYWLTKASSLLGMHAVALATLRELIEVFQFFSFRFLIPLGFLFRTFSYTRRLGSTMVSMGIGAAMLLPLAVHILSALTLEALDVLSFSSLSSSFASSLQSASLKVYPFMYIGDFFNALVSNLRAAVLVLLALDLLSLANIPIVSQIAQTAFSVMMFALKASYFTGLVGVIGSYAGMLLIYNSDLFFEGTKALAALNLSLTLFYFGVSAIVIGGIRAISIFLGGEFFLYGMGRIL